MGRGVGGRSRGGTREGVPSIGYDVRIGERGPTGVEDCDGGIVACQPVVNTFFGAVPTSVQTNEEKYKRVVRVPDRTSSTRYLCHR